MPKTLAFCFMAICTPVFAATFDLSRNYTLLAPPFTYQDKACLLALEEAVVPVFVGLNGAVLEGPSFARISNDRYTLLTYAGVLFQSKFGDVRGTLNCVFESNENKVATISVTFEARGLAGFRKHPLAKTLNDPSKQRTTGYSKEFFY